MSIFERRPDKEVEAMFEVEGNQASIRPHGRTRKSHGSPDASDPEVVRVLGPQDVVLANRFLCHMESRGGGDVSAQYRAARQAGRDTSLFQGSTWTCCARSTKATFP